MQYESMLSPATLVSVECEPHASNAVATPMLEAAILRILPNGAVFVGPELNCDQKIGDAGHTPSSSSCPRHSSESLPRPTKNAPMAGLRMRPFLMSSSRRSPSNRTCVVHRIRGSSDVTDVREAMLVLHVNDINDFIATFAPALAPMPMSVGK